MQAYSVCASDAASCPMPHGPCTQTVNTHRVDLHMRQQRPVININLRLCALLLKQPDHVVPLPQPRPMPMAQPVPWLAFFFPFVFFFSYAFAFAAATTATTTTAATAAASNVTAALKLALQVGQNMTQKSERGCGDWRLLGGNLEP